MKWVTMTFVQNNQYQNDVINFLTGLPDSKVHGANMGPIWGRQDPGGPHVGPMNLAIWVEYMYSKCHMIAKTAKQINIMWHI